MQNKKVEELIKLMSLEEKATFTTGRDNWFTKPVERLHIPSVRMSDGPHGLRTQNGEEISIKEEMAKKSVCFPAACATASSFDRSLLEELGKELGEEARGLGVNVLLGPGVNIKRSPLCGRNFEYFSEDSYLAGELGAAYVRGVQSQGVGCSLKHFAANNQEYRRMDASSEMDERTFREIYLSAFEKVVKEAKPWTVMASYNKIGGKFSAHNEELLTNILRGEWGFGGAVTSDWGATRDRVEAIQAGCDLTMPGEDTDDVIVKAVKQGKLAEEKLDQCCTRLLELAFKAEENEKSAEGIDYEKGHALARKIASESIVLLKNEDNLLPLAVDEEVAFIGTFAKKPRYQGGGSSHINSSRTEGALEAAKEMGIPVSYGEGYDEEGNTTESLLDEARTLAEKAKSVVVFIGLTDSMESEGTDRRHLHMPEGHNKLVDAVCSVNENVVVVLHNGSPVEMPWAEKPKAIVEAYLGGQAVGGAVVDVLTGRVNPSGHLPESFPIRLEDTSSYLSYFGENGLVRYQEGLFVGYRYYESKKQEVLFPFGHGLSFTKFVYSNLVLEKDKIDEGETLKVCVDVENVGRISGKALVQIYVAPEKVEMIRPVRELKAFEKVSLEAGEKKTVIIELSPRAFTHWNPTAKKWRAENGSYAIQVGLNAHDIVLEERVKVNAEPIPPTEGYTLSTSMIEVVKTTKGKTFLNRTIKYMLRGMAQLYMSEDVVQMLDQMGDQITLDTVNLLAQKVGKGAADVSSGLDAVLGQPLTLLYNFIPKEEKENLDTLLIELNR